MSPVAYDGTTVGGKNKPMAAAADAVTRITLGVFMIALLPQDSPALEAQVARVADFDARRA